MNRSKTCLNPFVEWALINTNKHAPKHFGTLLGERPAGSKWGREMTVADYHALQWEQAYVHDDCYVPPCIYLTAAFPEKGWDATQCISVFDAIPKGDYSRDDLAENVLLLEDVTVREGGHGRELVSDRVKPSTPYSASMIIGPAQDDDGNVIEGELMVHTAYPGCFTAMLPKDWDGNLETLDRDTPYAIKGL